MIEDRGVDLCDYLLSFGTAGDFGRFRTTTSFQVARGEPVVVRSYRGLELARVLCEATPGHARFLPNTVLGKLLRRRPQRLLRRPPRTHGQTRTHTARIAQARRRGRP